MMSKLDAFRVLIGENIRKERTAQRFSQDELAEIAGITSQFLSLIENGVRSASLSTYNHLADALNLPIGELFHSEDSNERTNFEARVYSILSGCTGHEKEALYEILKGSKAALCLLRSKCAADHEQGNFDLQGRD